MFLYFILTKVLLGKYYYHHFTTEAQRGQVFCQIPQAEVDSEVRCRYAVVQVFSQVRHIDRSTFCYSALQSVVHVPMLVHSVLLLVCTELNYRHQEQAFRNLYNDLTELICPLYSINNLKKKMGLSLCTSVFLSVSFFKNFIAFYNCSTKSFLGAAGEALHLGLVSIY